MGSFIVRVLDISSNILKKVWEMSGNQGKDWHQANVTIKNSGSYKVITVNSLILTPIYGRHHSMGDNNLVPAVSHLLFYTRCFFIRTNFFFFLKYFILI